jgi:hypothetical protein
MGMLGSEYTLSPQPTMHYMPSPPVQERPYTPQEGIYPPAIGQVSAGEMSSDSNRVPSPPQGSYALRSHRRQSSSISSQSPLIMPGPLVAQNARATHRYNPIAVPARATRRSRQRKDEFGSDDEEEEYVQQPLTSAPGTEARREEIRRQRIESEQRRRDELRDGYRRLKDALPPSNQKSSKVCLLDRATTHVKYLEVTNSQLQARVQAAESEVARLRQFNEALMLGTAESRHVAATAAAVAAAQAHGSPVF